MVGMGLPCGCERLLLLDESDLEPLSLRLSRFESLPIDTQHLIDLGGLDAKLVDLGLPGHRIAATRAEIDGDRSVPLPLVREGRRTPESLAERGKAVPGLLRAGELRRLRGECGVQRRLAGR